MTGDDFLLSQHVEVDESDFLQRLVYAESMLATCEEAQERLDKLFAYLSTSSLSALLLLVGGLITLARRVSYPTGLALLGAALTLAALAAQLWWTSLHDVRRRLLRDRATVGEIVAVLRSVWPPLAESSSMTFARRIELDSRLSRFPIEPSESGFGEAFWPWAR